jgi:hypothetical protein
MLKMDPQLVEAHKAYLRAYRELNKDKFYESYAKYTMANKEKIKEYQQSYHKHYYEKNKEEKKQKQRTYYAAKKIAGNTAS